jgi:electron transfer flavoprotein beta subunit
VFTTVVCVKICVDPAELRADPESGLPRLERVPWRISTFDENALEEAVRLKEVHGGVVQVLSLVSVAPPEELVLTMLAMGADAVYLVHDPSAADADSLATATILSAALKKLSDWSLVLCGEGSLDQYNRQLGPRIAEAMSIPSLTQVTRVEVTNRTIVAHRSLENRTEIAEGKFPAVLTVGQEINKPRYPSVLQIRGASTKPTVEWRLTDLGFPRDATAAGMSAVRTVRVFSRPTFRKRIPVEGENPREIARHLARALFEEGVLRTR